MNDADERDLMASTVRPNMWYADEARQIASSDAENGPPARPLRPFPRLQET
jgi:hypothetical protein